MYTCACDRGDSGRKGVGWGEKKMREREGGREEIINKFVIGTGQLM